MTRFTRLASTAAFAITIALSATSAFAATLVKLGPGDSLQTIDTTTRQATASVAIKGLTAPLAGFDIRPADGMLYGLQRDGQLVTIDMKTGQATAKAKLDQMLPAAASRCCRAC
jgi:hypothetical protein